MYGFVGTRGFCLPKEVHVHLVQDTHRRERENELVWSREKKKKKSRRDDKETKKSSVEVRSDLLTA